MKPAPATSARLTRVLGGSAATMAVASSRGFLRAPLARRSAILVAKSPCCASRVRSMASVAGSSGMTVPTRLASAAFSSSSRSCFRAKDSGDVSGRQVYPKVNGGWPFAHGEPRLARRTLARMQRRALLKSAGVLFLAARCAGLRPAPAAALPAEVAGVRLPRSALALKAAAYARASCPGFLFNHCMRTFLFGALKLQHQQLRY